jgi:hypothetical protein
MRRGRTGKPHNAAARAKMSAASRARGAWPPAAGRPWTAEEDALLSLPTAEAAARTGRSVGAVKCRRRELRRRAQGHGRAAAEAGAVGGPASS